MSVNFALIGAGRWGKNIAKALFELENCNLIAICDKDETRAKSLAKLYNTRSFMDTTTLLEKERDLEAVAIATPSETHFHIAFEAIKAGKHTFVEKPICDAVEKARKLVREAEKRHVKLMVGHIERFNPAVRELRKNFGKLGEVLSLFARRLGMFERPGKIGIIKDIAVHDIDIACWLLGKYPKSIFANCIFTDAGRDIYANILLIFKREFGYLEASWISNRKERSLTIVGNKANALLDFLDQSIVLEYADKQEKLPVKKENYLKTELSHFVTCILEDTVPLVTGLDGLRSLEIAEAALESAIKKKIVNIY